MTMTDEARTAAAYRKWHIPTASGELRWPPARTDPAEEYAYHEVTGVDATVAEAVQRAVAQAAERFGIARPRIRWIAEGAGSGDTWSFMWPVEINGATVHDSPPEIWLLEGRSRAATVNTVWHELGHVLAPQHGEVGADLWRDELSNERERGHV